MTAIQSGIGGHILAILNQQPDQARYVGGMVRDHLMGIVAQDIDIATIHQPKRVMELLAAEGIKVIPTGIQHGTVTAVMEGQPVEITTLRRDVACDGRHADIVYTDSWEEDAKRRDFTINAMSLDQKSNLYDYFNGKDDLKHQRVRFVGDAAQRIQEDYLRILRFFRFHVQIGAVEFAPAQLQACQDNADGIKQLSGERIKQEMLKIFSFSSSLSSLLVMLKSDIADNIFAQKAHQMVFDGDISRLSGLYHQLKIKDPILLLALWGHIIGYKVEPIIDRWKFSNKEADYLRFLCNANLINGNEMPSESEVNRLLYHYRCKWVTSRLMLQWVLLRYGNKACELKSLKSLLAKAEMFEKPSFPLESKDISALGIPPGKQMGDLLREAESLWIHSNFSLTYEDLMQKIKARLC